MVTVTLTGCQCGGARAERRCRAEDFSGSF